MLLIIFFGVTNRLVIGIFWANIFVQTWSSACNFKCNNAHFRGRFKAKI